jgi:hypothetical protein
MTADLIASHTRKNHNTKRSRADGIRLIRRSGEYTYLKYSGPFGVIFIPAIEGAWEQIECRTGDSAFTVTGRNLWPLVEDLQAEHCEEIRESDPARAKVPAVPYVESITVRLWL